MAATAEAFRHDPARDAALDAAGLRAPGRQCRRRGADLEASTGDDAEPASDADANGNDGPGPATGDGTADATASTATVEDRPEADSAGNDALPAILVT